MLPRQQCKRCLYRLPSGDGNYNYCQYILVTKKRRPAPTTPGVCPVRKESRRPYFKTGKGEGLY